MKQLTGCARNLTITLDDAIDPPKPAMAVEVVLMTIETPWKLNDHGDLVRDTVLSEMRFLAGSNNLRTLSAQLTEWADEADGITVTIALPPEPEQPEKTDA